MYDRPLCTVHFADLSNDDSLRERIGDSLRDVEWRRDSRLSLNDLPVRQRDGDLLRHRRRGGCGGSLLRSDCIPHFATMLHPCGHHPGSRNRLARRGAVVLSILSIRRVASSTGRRCRCGCGCRSSLILLLLRRLGLSGRSRCSGRGGRVLLRFPLLVVELSLGLHFLSGGSSSTSSSGCGLCSSSVGSGCGVGCRHGGGVVVGGSAGMGAEATGHVQQRGGEWGEKWAMSRERECGSCEVAERAVHPRERCAMRGRLGGPHSARARYRPVTRKQISSFAGLPQCSYMHNVVCVVCARLKR